MGLLYSLETGEAIGELTNELNSKSFIYEILTADDNDYLRPGSFLTKEELELLAPENASYSDYSELIAKDPHALLAIFRKVYQHLKDNAAEMPLFHYIGIAGGNFASSSDDFLYNGATCSLWGRHAEMAHRQEIQLFSRKKSKFSLLADDEQKTEWIKADSTIVLGDNRFEIMTNTTFDEYKDELEELAGICEKAIGLGRKLYWYVM